MQLTIIYLRNTSAFIGAFLLGNLANMGIIMVGTRLIPPPVGMDASEIESLKVNMYLFENKHFIMPFLAHAFGTWVAAYIVARLAVSLHFKLAMAMGILFLLGGITNVVLLPTPVWFTLSDLVLAYIPMGYLGWKVSTL